MPKTLTPLSRLRCDPGAVQAFQRFARWTWVITGLAFAIVWLATALAEPVSLVLLVSGMVLIATRIVRLHRTRRKEA